MDMPAPPEDASSMARYECNKHKNRNMEDVACEIIDGDHIKCPNGKGHYMIVT